MLTVLYPTGERVRLWLPGILSVGTGSAPELDASRLEYQVDDVLVAARLLDLRALFGQVPQRAQGGGQLIEVVFASRDRGHRCDETVRFWLAGASGSGFLGQLDPLGCLAEYRHGHDRRRVQIRDPRSLFLGDDVELSL